NWSSDVCTSPLSPIPVSTALTVTGTYGIQYQVSFAQTGIGTDTGTNTVLTVGATTFARSGLPSGGLWLDSGTAWSFSSPVASSASKQYRWDTTNNIYEEHTSELQSREKGVCRPLH